MGATQNGSRIIYGRVLITLEDGDGSAAVTFECPFSTKPALLLVPHLGDEAATLTATSQETTGFTFTVAGSDIPDGTVYFEWVAHEKT